MKEGLMMILKFFSFLLILPLVIASVLAFQTQALGLSASKEQWLLWGAVIFILLYLFLYNFKEVYTFGQTIVSNLVKFFEPLVSVAGLIVPIYTILIVCGYLFVHVFDTTGQYEGYILLVMGFSVAMHIILTAHQLYEADSSPLKAQYLFSFGLALIVNLFVIALLLSFAIAEFSFVGFFKALSSHTASYYQAIFKALFVSSS